MDGDIKGQSLVTPAKQAWHQDQVRGTRYRQEFRQTLQQGQQYGL
jgi:hypothetical protein